MSRSRTVAGVLRALGFQRAMVARSFLIETGFVVGVGVLSGTALGLMLSRNLFASEDFASASASFTIPWAMVTLVATFTVVAALLMTWIPARRAARIPRPKPYGTSKCLPLVPLLEMGRGPDLT